MKPSLPALSSLPARLRGLRRSTVALASAAACAVGLLAAPVASANPGGKDLVVFGDSFASNPTLPAGHYIAGTAPNSGSRVPVTGSGGCPQDRENWPRVAAGGLDVLQWIDTGTLVAGIAGVLPSGYHATIAEVRRQVQAAAPNAEIVMAGYPELGAGDNVCLINVTPNQPAPLMLPGIAAVESGLQSSIRSAADANGIRFVDMKALTAGHGTCAAPDSQRYVAGIYDQTSDHNMKLHPTLEGSRAMGRIMADNLR